MYRVEQLIKLKAIQNFVVKYAMHNVIFQLQIKGHQRNWTGPELTCTESLNSFDLL